MSATGTPSSAVLGLVESKLVEVRDQMRSAIPEIGDPQGKALLETGAEVLGGLLRAFTDYAEGTETAWQR